MRLNTSLWAITTTVLVARSEQATGSSVLTCTGGFMALAAAGPEGCATEGTGGYGHMGGARGSFEWRWWLLDLGGSLVGARKLGVAFPPPSLCISSDTLKRQVFAVYCSMPSHTTHGLASLSRSHFHIAYNFACGEHGHVNLQRVWCKFRNLTLDAAQMQQAAKFRTLEDHQGQERYAMSKYFAFSPAGGSSETERCQTGFL
jgi:hypothetical protein